MQKNLTSRNKDSMKVQTFQRTDCAATSDSSVGKEKWEKSKYEWNKWEKVIKLAVPGDH